MTDQEIETRVKRVKTLYGRIISGKMNDGCEVVETVQELEKTVSKNFNNTQQFHYYVAEYLKRKDRVGETMGRRLLRMRKKSKLTQIELAALLGVDRKTVTRWETGDQTPTEKAVSWMNSINEPSGGNGTFEAKQDEYSRPPGFWQKSPREMGHEKWKSRTF